MIFNKTPSANKEDILPVRHRYYEWLPMPENNNNDEVIYALFALFPNSENKFFVEFNVPIIVDWGNGVIEYYNDIIDKNLNYNDFPNQILTLKGYKQTMVKITPQNKYIHFLYVTFLYEFVYGIYKKLNILDLYIYSDYAMLINVNSLFELPLLEYLSIYTPNCTEIYLKLLPSLYFLKLNTSISNYNYMLDGCSSLQIINDSTYVGENFAYMFYNCYSLETISNIDVSFGTDFSGMFFNCYSLETIPQIDTSNGINFSEMFNDCYSLETIPVLDVSNGTNFDNMFSGCLSLTAGRLNGTKYDISYANCNLSNAALNDIYDGLGVVTGKTITVTGNFKGSLYGDPYYNPSIATNKGWTVIG